MVQAKGPAKAIKREKGVEKQFWLNCMQCDAVRTHTHPASLTPDP